MLENEFYTWLLTKRTDNQDTASSRKSNCLRVCEFEGDLDIHFEEDECCSLIEKLTYSVDDERNNRPPKHKIPIDGNVRTVTSTFKQAVRLYVEFKNDMKNGFHLESQSTVKNNKYSSKMEINSSWPTWELPVEEEIYQLAQITTKYIRFLNPDIIKVITEDNMEHYDEWRNLLSTNKVNPDLYLWELSPCCFPGVRRYAGSKERSNFRKQKSKIPDALKLDDNDFPKEIWSFIFTGKEFRKLGPKDYSLAHLFDHKEYKNRMRDELEFHVENNHPEPPYFGLYTCPTNTVFIPISLLKPTDFNVTLRRLLFQKAESLYKDCCNILPPFIKIPKPENEEWNIERFQWGECVGTLDNISVFLDYRNEKMKEMLG